MLPNAISICRNPVTTCHKDVTDEAVRRPEPSHLSHSFVTVLRQMAERGETAETPIKTHILLFSAIICRTVTGGRGRNQFLVVFGHESASAPRAREKCDRCKAGGRPPVPESRGGSPLNPFKGQGAGRSGAYNHTLFISGKSRKGEKHD